MNINAKNLDFKKLNAKIRTVDDDIYIDNCCGQRYICSGLKDKKLTINGIAGNALGAYLNGSIITVNDNVQDAVGDTMNEGKIIIHGNAGDALGYAMRGGSIFVRGEAGYRAGVHMKEYQDKKPVIVIGSRAGSFLGEYLAGGIIIVLGIGVDDIPIGNFTGTGMHGGCIFIRTNKSLDNLPKQVTPKIASKDDLKQIEEYVFEYAKYFEIDAKTIMKDNFYILKPNAKNPYKQLYTAY